MSICFLLINYNQLRPFDSEQIQYMLKKRGCDPPHPPPSPPIAQYNMYINYISILHEIPHKLFSQVGSTCVLFILI